jgi:hypothetical protein
MLVGGNKLMFVPKHEEAWPKDFLEVLVRSDLRKWIEAVKAEIQSWSDNDAVEIGMFKDVPTSMISNKQTRTAPDPSCAGSKVAFDTSTDVIRLRSWLSELGNRQNKPKVLYQDNTAVIQISSDCGSLGTNFRAMDMKVLTTRNRIEDHRIATQYSATTSMIADVGTKALPEVTFVRLRDMMNGYALVKARSPELQIPHYVFTKNKGKVQMSYVMAVEMISQQPYDMSGEEQEFDLRAYYDDGDEIEEKEEDDDSDDSDNDQHADVDIETKTIEPDEEQVNAVDIHRIPFTLQEFVGKLQLLSQGLGTNITMRVISRIDIRIILISTRYLRENSITS